MGRKTRFPFVSVCTPTFNRRPFIPMLLECYAHQTYPRNRMEFVIVDDGSDSVEDLVKAEAARLGIEVHYHRYEEHMPLGKKRNVMHSLCRGDIIVYMDDDDFYPPERVAHAVEELKAHPRFLIAGTSEMHSYFARDGSMKQLGPFGTNRATAASFAFRRELLAQTSYDDADWMSEERKFLKGYTIPLYQLDPHKTILVFSHKQNSLDRETLYLDFAEGNKVQPSRYTVGDFIGNADLRRFYTEELLSALDAYAAGSPDLKPVIAAEVTKRKQKWMQQRERRQAAEAEALAQVRPDIKAIRDEYEAKLDAKTHMINELVKRVRLLKEENDELRASLAKAGDGGEEMGVGSAKK